jgi:lipoyl(octanoyl) transferase
MDLEPFRRINPCGYEGLQVTSVVDLGGPSEPAALVCALVAALSAQLGLSPDWQAGSAIPTLPVIAVLSESHP